MFFEILLCLAPEPSKTTDVGTWFLARPRQDKGHKLRVINLLLNTPPAELMDERYTHTLPAISIIIDQPLGIVNEGPLFIHCTFTILGRE